MRLLYKYILAVLAFFAVSCKEFLDIKPDRSLAVPTSIEDLQAILDYESRMTLSYPLSGDIGAGYYFLSEDNWSSRTEEMRNTYVWDDFTTIDLDWTYGYTTVFNANVVLEAVDEAVLGNHKETDRQRVKGSALFFRAWAFYHLAQLFAPHYGSVSVTGADTGIPLKLSSDINEPTKRSTLRETYDRILHDLELASQLLPEISLSPTRPNKQAAFAVLAKTYLVMGHYELAASYADSCLLRSDVLIDFNTIDTNRQSTFTVFNPEVIFHSVIRGQSSAVNPSVARVDTALYRSYHVDDLRKYAYYTKTNDGYSFKGCYSGANTASLFNGIARDEIFLLKAECEIRLGYIDNGINYLNHLLATRWKEGAYEPYAPNNQDAALRLVIDERMKELAFRGGIYWTDLRRLNFGDNFGIQVQRKIGDREFTLPPNDLRYTFLIPSDVIVLNGIKQNPR